MDIAHVLYRYHISKVYIVYSFNAGQLYVVTNECVGRVQLYIRDQSFPSTPNLRSHLIKARRPQHITARNIRVWLAKVRPTTRVAAVISSSGYCQCRHACIVFNSIWCYIIYILYIKRAFYTMHDSGIGLIINISDVGGHGRRWLIESPHRPTYMYDLSVSCSHEIIVYSVIKHINTTRVHTIG